MERERKNRDGGEARNSVVIVVAYDATVCDQRLRIIHLGPRFFRHSGYRAKGFD